MRVSSSAISAVGKVTTIEVRGVTKPYCTKQIKFDNVSYVRNLKRSNGYSIKIVKGVKLLKPFLHNAYE